METLIKGDVRNSINVQDYFWAPFSFLFLLLDFPPQKNTQNLVLESILIASLSSTT